MATTKHEVINNTQGWIGVITLNRRNEETAVNVEPLGRIFMTDEEIELTKQAQAKPENSPFLVRDLVHTDPLTGDVAKEFRAAPLEVKRKPVQKPKSKPASRGRARATA